LSTEGHTLGVAVEPKSKASLKLRGFPLWPIDKFVELEGYEIRFKFKNLGKRRFPGGTACMTISWRYNQAVVWHLKIPALDPEKDEYAEFPNGSITAPSEVLSSGFGLISCLEIKDQHKQDVELKDYEGKILFGVGRYATSIKSIKATTWASSYGWYPAIAAVGSLLILAADKLILILRWLLPGLDP
jgi:hypothetical protein